MEPVLDIPDHIKALPEPEQGPALVEEIHRRKDVREAVQYFTANRIIAAPLGDGLDGAEVLNGFVDGLRATIEEEDGASKAQYTRRLNGPSSLQVWIDEAQQWRDAHAPSKYSELFNEEGRLTSASIEFQCVDVSNELMAVFLGYESVDEMLKEQAARRHLWNQVDDMLARPVDAPPVEVDNVRWPSDNRKLYARRDGKTSELYRMLGIEES